MKNINYTFLLVLLASALSAQSFEKDMQIIYNKFVSAKKISYNIKYLLKENHNVSSKIISENSGRYIKSDVRSISQYASKYTLTLPNEVIMVDMDDKYIRVKKHNNQQTNDADFLVQLSEYNKSIENVVLLGTNKKDVQTYSVQLKNSPLFGISKYEISFNKKTWFIEQITLFYKKPLEADPENNIKGTEIPRLEIIFSDFNSPKIYKPLELESSFYYKKENNKITSSENFQYYDIREIY